MYHLEPAFVVLLAFFTLGETAIVVQIASMVLVVVGVVLSSRATR